jgi:xylitol oxidase
MNEPIRNWAGNIAFGAGVTSPRSVGEVQDLVRRARKVRAVGSRHSFNRIADTDGTLVSLQHLNRLVGIDADARTVTVEGGITYGQLCPLLEAEGFALANLASLPHISVAGACATATHGSGNANRNLAGAVSALEIVTAEGEMLRLRRGDPGFEGAVVHLGGLGIVTAVTLDIVPRFEVRQDVFIEMPFRALVDNFEAVSAAAYSVSAFTRWRGDSIAQVWLKSRTGLPAPTGDFFGARAAETACHPIPTIDPAPTTQQLGVAGPWHERLPHFRMAFTPSAGEELQSEYFVGRADAPAALHALKAIEEVFAPPLMISEIRTIAADALWMSPCHRRDSVAFHFTWLRDWPAVQAVLPAIEEALAPFGARPHWGKLFTMAPADVQARYERLADFRALLARHDAEGKFRNGFLETYVF